MKPEDRLRALHAGESRMSMNCIVEQTRSDDCKQYPACFAVVAAIVALTAALSVFWVLLLHRDWQGGLASTLPPGPVCQNSQCASAAKVLKAVMKPEADPCGDFYTYVCGNYKHPLGLFIGQLDYEMYRALARTLDAASSLPSGGQTASQKAVALYKNCAEGRVDETEELRKFVESVGLGLSTYADADVLDKIIMLFFKYNIAILLELSLDDAKLSRHKRLLVLAVSSSQLRWMSERSKTAPLDLFYLSHMAAFGLHVLSDEALHTAQNIIRAETTAMGVYHFDRSVNAAHITRFLLVIHLNALTRNILPGRWASLISTHSGGVYGAQDEVQVTLSALTYIDALQAYLGRQLNLLAAWELIRNLMPLASRKLAASIYPTKFKFYCLDAVTRAMEVPLLSWYLFKQVPQSTVTAARDMADHIRKSVLEEIDRATWLDNATKVTAMYKVHAMELHVGYPTYFTSEEELNTAYHSYPDVGNNFFAPWLKAMGKTVAWRITNHSSFYCGVQDLPRFGRDRGNQRKGDGAGSFSVSWTNAFYALFRNKMVLPAPILRPPLFSPALPKAINYAALGGIIGHEITHAFDLQGRLIDAKGRLVNWWSNSSRKQYRDRVDCLRRSHGAMDGAGTAARLNPLKSSLCPPIKVAGGSTTATKVRASAVSSEREHTDLRFSATVSVTQTPVNMPDAVPSLSVVLQQPRESPTFQVFPGGDPEDWLEKFKRVAPYNRWPADPKQHVFCSLEGAARTWFENREATITPLGSFKTQCLQAFTTVLWKYCSELFLQERVQLPNKTILVYFEDLAKLFRPADPNMSEENKLR
ncbi:neprilysin-1-like [Amblyomma americanum]